jgi:hypothetical protein
MRFVRQRTGRWVMSALRGALIVVVATFLTQSCLLHLESSVGADPASGSSPTSGSSTPASNPLQTISNCVHLNGRLAVTFLVDESGSLGYPSDGLPPTDPTNTRVGAIQAALTGLNALTDGEGRALVDVEMTGFSYGAQQRQPWTALNDGSLPGLVQAATGFAKRNSGFETDYYSGLTTAKEELDQQAIAMNPSGSTPVCKMMIWITDGRMEIDNRTNQSEISQYGSTVPWGPDIPLTSSQPGINVAATNRARSLLCNPGGIVDQMRNDSVFSAVVPLDYEGNIASADLDFLGAVAQGSYGGITCGTPGPSALASGTLAAANDEGELIGGFYSASVQTPPTLSSTTGVCSPAAGTCPSGTKTFILDPSLGNFSVLAEPQNANLDVEITGPNAQSLPLTRGVPGSASLAGAQLKWTWFTPTVLLVTGSLPAGVSTWNGTWSVTFIDPTGTDASAVNSVAVYLFGNLEAIVPPGTSARKGRTTDIPIEIVSGPGSPQSDPAILKDVSVSTTVTTGGGAPEPLVVRPSSTVPGQYVASYSPSADLAVSTATIQTSLTINTSDGVSLPPATETYSLPLLNPIGFPSLLLGRQGTVFLTPIKNAGEAATGSLVVHAGGAESRGCLWLSKGSVIRKPQNTRTVNYRMEPGSSEADCLRFNPETNQTVKVTATIQGYGLGEVNGSLKVLMRSSIDGSTRVEYVPVQFQMSVPIELDTATALWLLLLSILGPLLVLYLINWTSTKFLAFDQLRYVESSVQVAKVGEHFAILGPLEVVSSDAVILNRPDSLRSFAIGNHQFRVRMPWSPIGVVEGRVASPPKLVVTNLGLLGNGSEGVVTRGLGSIWIGSVAAESLEVALRGDQVAQLPFDVGILIVMNTDGDPTAQLEKVTDEVSSRLPELLDALAAKQESTQRTSSMPVTDAVEPDQSVEIPTESKGDSVYLGGYDLDGTPQPASFTQESPPTSERLPTDQVPVEEAVSATPTDDFSENVPPDRSGNDVYLGGYEIDGPDSPA